MQSDIDALRRTEIFAALPDEVLDSLARCVQHRVYQPSSRIFAEGDAGDALFIVQAGEVQLSVLSATGQKIMLATVGEGDMFGDLALLDGVPRSATATATTDCRCLILRRDDFLGVVESQPTAIRGILRTLAGIIRNMNVRLADVAMLDVHGRMAKAILELVDHYGQPREGGAMLIDRVISAADLAAVTGLYPVEVERLLRNYQYEDIIRLDDGRITVPRLHVLRAWLPESRRA